MAKILIVEDEAPIALLLRRVLAGVGHEVVTAENGNDACRVAEQASLDLILSDLSLPSGPQGADLVRRLRTAQPACPLVVVSGYSSPDYVEEYKQLGVTDFLAKPFEILSVRAFVDSILRRCAA